MADATSLLCWPYVQFLNDMVSEIYNLIMGLGKYFGDTHICAAINLKFLKRSSAIFIL